MTRATPQGFATLLITVMLLSSALLVTLSLCRNLFFQIKRAQNEVRASQQFWMAEGGLECVYSLIQNEHRLPSEPYYPECGSAVRFSYDEPERGRLVITAEAGYRRVSKTLRTATPSSGVVQATSRLLFTAGIALNPDPGRALENNQWACTLLRYRADLVVRRYLSNTGLQPPPFSAGNALLHQRCDSNYVTHLLSSDVLNPAAMKKDVIRDETLTPFEDLFGVPRADWFKVMADEQVSKIAAILLTGDDGRLRFTQQNLPTAERIPDCGDQIRRQLLAGHDLLWVYGSCYLSASDVSQLRETIRLNARLQQGIVLVLHNGLFATKGTLTFPGMIVHLISSSSDGTPDFTPGKELWDALNPSLAVDLESRASLNGSDLPAMTVHNTAYFDQGGFYPTGGYVLDAPGTYAVFTSPFDFHFEPDAAESALNKIRAFNWQAGSWYVR